MLAFLLAGCHGCIGPDYTPRPHQDQAMNLVWTQSYGLKEKPPTVGWMTQPSLNCHDDGKEDDGFILDDGDCVWGVSYINRWEAQVSWPDTIGMFSLHSTFAHELYHFRMFIVTGDPDTNHADSGFEERYGHPPGGAVELANELLMENQL